MGLFGNRGRNAAHVTVTVADFTVPPAEVRVTCGTCNGRGKTESTRYELEPTGYRLPRPVTELKTCTTCNGMGKVTKR